MPEFISPPDGFRFTFGGLNVRDLPDALGPTKYASAQNIRANANQSIRTRPGYTSLFSTGGLPITDIRAYASLGSDDLPRYLCRDNVNGIYLDTGSLVVTLSGDVGFGVSLLPFRPAESPETWMYCASLGDYRKLSAPDDSGVVIAQKVGIAESPTQLEAGIAYPGFKIITAAAASWTQGGTAGGPADGTRSSETDGVVRPDPVISSRNSIQVGAAVAYQIGEVVLLNGANLGIVQDVLPPVAGGVVLLIQAIRYASGTSGRATIVPSQQPLSQDGILPELGNLRRGALINLNSSEIVLVLETVRGPDGSLCFECVTSGTFSAGQTLTGVPAIVVDTNSIAAGQTITSAKITSAITTGIGTLSQTLATSPFAQDINFGSPVVLPQPEDFVHLSLNISDPTLLLEAKIIFNVDSADTTFTKNVYYYSIRPSDLALVATSAQTQQDSLLQGAVAELVDQAAPEGENPPGQSLAGGTQWLEIQIPISSLTRLGGDQSRTLVNCTGVQILVNCSGAVTLAFGSLWIGGRSQPDVGSDGASYRYRAVPRSSLTGARGNATPDMRYGVRPRRQPVTVNLPSASYDSQIDTWDIYRYGGSVTSYRYLGSAPTTASSFIDTYFDDSLRAGRVLEIDNFEPWPSVGVPFKVTSDQATIAIVGTWVTISGFGGAWPEEISRWLPGTLVLLGGKEAFTLRNRPTQVSATSYRFELEECANFSAAAPSFWVLEPRIARQILPYLWGPNESGDFFGVGDPLRPGSVSFTKNNNPDSAPDAYNLDLSPPSEPLIGGDLARGIALVASTRRWWALYPAFNTPRRYNPIEQSVGRGMVAPYGHCNDGVRVYFWARDGICATDGGPFKSLTDEDLYGLFPHEGVPGANVDRGGITYYAPDYSRAATFRLSRVNYYLYANYQASDASPRTLVCDLRNGSWSSDSYADQIVVHFGSEQQAGTLSGSSPEFYPPVVMGDTAGIVHQQVDLHNDGSAPIVGVLRTAEWSGGDLRPDDLWGDGYLDCLAPAGLTVAPLSEGLAILAATVVPASPSRQFPVVSLGGGQLVKFVGLAIGWVDDFTIQDLPTTLNLWQLSRISQPETITDRNDDWTIPGPNRFFQGLLLDANTYGADKLIKIRDADSNTLHVLQPSPVNHPRRQTVAYSFETPFYAHSVRRESLDQVPWTPYSIEYISEPAPESVQTWKTQFTAHGLRGYFHISKMLWSYSASAPVTLTISAYDGISPQAIILPATGGVVEKLPLRPTFNKGLLYNYLAVSSAAFQIWEDDCEVLVGQWDRTGGYINYPLVGGQRGDKARI